MNGEISTAELQRIAKKASSEAQARALEAAIPYTVQKGKKIIKVNPDGSEETVGTLSKAYVRLKQKYYQIV